MPSSRIAIRTRSDTGDLCLRSGTNQNRPFPHFCKQPQPTSPPAPTPGVGWGGMTPAGTTFATDGILRRVYDHTCEGTLHGYRVIMSSASGWCFAVINANLYIQVCPRAASFAEGARGSSGERRGVGRRPRRAQTTAKAISSAVDAVAKTRRLKPSRSVVRLIGTTVSRGRQGDRWRECLWRFRKSPSDE
jgi:hypothetical protein